MKEYNKYKLNLTQYSDRKVDNYEDYMTLVSQSILSTAEYKCLKEMYERAQPSVDYDELLKEHFNRTQNGLPAEAFYLRYYLSENEYQYIVNKYIKAYRLENLWRDNVQLVIDDLQRWRTSEHYIERTEKRPGYRSYKYVAPLKVLIEKELNGQLDIKTEVNLEDCSYKDEKDIASENDIQVSETAERIAKKVIDQIKDIKDFYKFDRYKNSFTFSVSDISPNSNVKSVKEYWKKQGIDLEIDLREYDQDYFWCEENGYCYEDLEGTEIGMDDGESTKSE